MSNAPARPDDNASFAEKVRWLLQTHAYFPKGDRVVQLYEPSDECLLTCIAFERGFKSWAEITTGPKGGVNVLPATTRWEFLPQRLTVEGVRMRPDREFPTYEENGKLFKNTYRKIEHSGKGDITPWLDLMTHLLPVESERKIFCDWLAHKWRHPEIPGFAVVMVATDAGGQPVYGTGRGILRDIIARLLGRRYVHPQDFNILTGTSSQAVYTDWQAYALLVTVNEAKETRDAGRWAERRAVYEHLKEIIDPRPIEHTFTVKGLPSFRGISYTTFLIASNNSDALQIPPGDRRFAVLRNGIRMPGEMAAKLTKWMEGAGNITALAQWLEARDLGAFDPYVAPETAGKTHMQELAQDELGRALAAIKTKLGRTALFTHAQITAAVWEEMEDGTAGVKFEELCRWLYRPLRAMARQQDRDKNLRMPQTPSGERASILCWRDYEGPAEVDQATAVSAVEHTAAVLAGKTDARWTFLHAVTE